MGAGSAAVSGEPRLTVHLVSLFPSIFRSWLEQGVVSRAAERGLIRIDMVNLREFGVGRHQVTDDYPFGGGTGMVLKPEPIFGAVESLRLSSSTPVMLLSPRGRRFDQAHARELAALDRFVLVSGQYEGVDERVIEHLITDEISIGDYVLSAGELAAMVVTDAVVRLLPGALSEGGADEESFTAGLLEYPQYTRPADFRDWPVPDILLSGHHARISAWRRHAAILRTARSRPDLLATADLTAEERALLDRDFPESPTI